MKTSVLHVLCSAFLLLFSLSLSAGTIQEKGHPRIVFDAEDFKTLKKMVRSRSNVPVVKMHGHLMKVADEVVADTSVLRFEKDAANRRIYHVAAKAENRLIPCAYAFRMTGKKKYLRKVESDMLTVCNFHTWNPTHYLDVAMMTLGVSVAYDWLYHDLEPAVKAAAERAMYEYAMVPSRSGDKNMVWWYNVKNNWNSVCNAGLTATSLAMYDLYPEMAQEIIDDAVRTSGPAVRYMYGPDGAYPEGPSYWTYGTTYQIFLNTMLECAFGTDFGLSDAPGFLETSMFKLFSRAPTGQYFNFADSSPGAGFDRQFWYFAAKKNDPSILYSDLKGLDSPDYAGGSYHGHIAVSIRHAMTLETSGVTAPSYKFYSAQGHVPVMMCRSGWTAEDHYLGIKGGKDGYNHGHMDAGTFVYEAYGVRWALDLPRQSYAELERGLKPFGKRLIDPSQDSWRWKIFRINCRQHNTLTVNDKDHNVKAVAKMTAVENTPERMSATFDLTPQFDGDLVKAERTAALCNEEYLEVKDVMAAPSDRPAHVRWTFVTEAVPEIVDDGIILRQNGIEMLLQASGADVNYRQWSSDPQDYDSPIKHLDNPNPGVYICGYEIDIPASTGYTIVVTLKRR